MVITLSETAQRLKTIFPNGNVVRTLVLPVENSLQYNSIGERKRWEIDITTDASLFGTTIYINPALFVPSGQALNFTPPGYNYYSVSIPAGGSIGTVYEAALTVSGTPAPKLVKNFRVAIRITSDFTFTVFVDFFMTYDANGFLETIQHDNVARFFKDIKTNPESGIVSDPDSVYLSEDRAAKVMVMQQKYNGENGYCVASTNFKGIFYGEGTMSNGQFVFKRDGAVVDTLSTGDNTDVEFYIDSPDGVENVAIWMLRTNINDSSKDFLQNYAYDWKLIVSGAVDSTKIIGPFTSPQLVDVDNNTYRATFRINASELTIGETYRLIGVAYSPVSASFTVGAWPSDPVDAADSPCFDGTGFDLEGYFKDYNVLWSGNDLEACIEERMQSVLFMNFTGDKWKNYLLSRLGLAGTNDIRRYLTQVTCTIYREFTDSSSNLIRHIYKTGTVTKTSPLTYSNTTDIAASFPNNGTAEFTFDWRNRYEAGTLNLQSLINGVNITPFDNQYWGGKTFKVEWELTFYYDDYSAPFNDIVRFTQQLSVKDYDNSGAMLLIQDGEEPESVDVCFGSNLCLKALSPDPIADFKLISTIEPAPGNVAIIEEAEAWVGNELPQLTTDKIYDQEEDFGQTEAGYAKFCVDTTKLTLNLPYKITAIAKPEYEGCRRVTEHKDAGGNFDEPRVTEVNEQRVPEECYN